MAPTTRPCGRAGLVLPVPDTGLAPAAGLRTQNEDWDAISLRFAAYGTAVDCVIVGGLDPGHVERTRFLRLGGDWDGRA